MKQSLFQQEYLTSGINGSFTGKVVVSMNYSSKTITGTHSYTHDDFTKQIPVHKIEGYCNGELICIEKDIQSETEVLKKTIIVKEIVNGKLYDLANNPNNPPQQTFAEKMKDALT